MTSANTLRPVRILVVCTANICRSPAMEMLLQDSFSRAGLPPDEVDVASSGVDALEGSARCARSRLLADAHAEAQDNEALWTSPSRLLRVEQIASADLVLTAARIHRGAVARLLPTARGRTFTLLQAARAADMIVANGLPEVVPLPQADDPRGRLRWLVAELDAARGPVQNPDDDDVPDPHLTGDAEHEPAMALMASAIERLGILVTTVLGHP
ncbi:unannotated protein [freshwater metagenome]|uniref:Unannotated protein n=1 Tax=freshwater metagenome TaxID=449393 RepID=A0A6J7C4G4_9ZZZZ|nr:hypothetical protein [Actinomycetota bacterium]